ncbi:FAD/NAD-binding domain-containing protein [Pleurotus eryngii]|uniref:FAD/NAD-binding domain-containing protein n=1 Tax=Pleurotus eryngii TaxID=5323 RepID=A0A9P5ZR15_PLEER|nr:FAD/NAD-binding domain-containing protein [Pleurotus eryngii]
MVSVPRDTPEVGKLINGHTSDPSLKVNSDTGKKTSSTFVSGKFSIDEPRPIKVVVIGAGYSGIIAGIRFTQRVQNLDLTIYDANAGIGGTWFANKYPGLACDLPSHCYQLSFENNINWSSFYSPGPEILAYLQGVVDKYKLMKYMKLQHRLVEAKWDGDAGKWRLRMRRPVLSAAGEAAFRQPPPNEAGASNIPKVEFEEFEDSADVLFTGIGNLNRWYWPDIPGLEDFKGKILHSAQWDTGDSSSGWEESVKDWKDKRVGVIGVGSSAIQIVPALQPKVGHLVNYVRGQTWLAVPFLDDMQKGLAKGGEVTNYKYTDEDKEAFKDPEFYKNFRRKMESELNAAQDSVMVGTEMQAAARTIFKEQMLKRLAKKPWIADHIIPEFPVACRRLTPGVGYLEALCEDNVDFVPSLIKRVTPEGIETVDGDRKVLDVIVCATGFDTSYQLDFPIIGKNGVDVRDKYLPHPRTYLSVAVEGFPNWFQTLGPNSAVGAGSLLIILEKQVDYAVEATLKIQRERLKSMDPKKEAVDDFDEYLEAWFPRTVFGQKCRSWYKVGKEEGRVVALWPGSCLHAVEALEKPRWEDYNYELLDKGVKNRFFYLGDGLTKNEKIRGDMATYLDRIDHPPVPSS